MYGFDKKAQRRQWLFLRSAKNSLLNIPALSGKIRYWRKNGGTINFKNLSSTLSTGRKVLSKQFLTEFTGKT
jgi:hypothetical protein